MSTRKSQEEIPKEVQQWLRMILGEYVVLATYRAGSHRTGVWQIESAHQRYFFKLHHNRIVWYSEIYAYQHWSVAYEPYVPSLIAVFADEQRQGLLITAIKGIPFKDTQLGETAALEVYQEAGRLCAQLHKLPAGNNFGLVSEQGLPVNYQGLPLGGSAADPVAFIRDNFLELLTHALSVGGIEPDELPQFEQALDAMDVFAPEAPAVVNTDYTPGNWLVDHAGKFVGIIDLEHIFPNLMIDAFTRLIVVDNPRGTHAFFEGFGYNPLRTQQTQARIVCLRHALYYVGYGMVQQNKLWLERGKTIFRQLDTLMEGCLYQS